MASDRHRQDWRVIGRQVGVDYRDGHKQGLVCFPSPQFCVRSPANTSTEFGKRPPEVAFRQRPGYARRMGTPFKPAENHSAFFHRKDGSDAASQKQFWIVAGSWRKPWAA